MNTELPQVYLLDVEGTVAPISFVYEQLFPYARAHFVDFLERNHSNPAVTVDLALLIQENRAETDAEAPHVPPVLSHKIDPVILSEAPFSGVEGPAFRNVALAYLNWLMDRDRKSTALKSLQGKIWKSGFESGELKGTLFADVPDAMRGWSTIARIAIYSSGSVEAQQLLFRHSIFGDLTSLIAAYFDTRTGPKQASASYAAIAATMNVAPAEVLFLSDVVRELDAARDAGCGTRLVVREGNAPVKEVHGHECVETLQWL